MDTLNKGFHSNSVRVNRVNPEIVMLQMSCIASTCYQKKCFLRKLIVYPLKSKKQPASSARTTLLPMQLRIKFKRLPLLHDPLVGYAYLKQFLLA